MPSTVTLDARTFTRCADSIHAIGEINWARSILARPVYTMPNGLRSHEVAVDVIDRAEDRLIDFLRISPLELDILAHDDAVDAAEHFGSPRPL